MGVGSTPTAPISRKAETYIRGENMVIIRRRKGDTEDFWNGSGFDADRTRAKPYVSQLAAGPRIKKLNDSTPLFGDNNGVLTRYDAVRQTPGARKRKKVDKPIASR